MSLQKLIEKMKSELKDQKGFPAVEISASDLGKLCEATEVMQSELKNLAHGENRPGQHRQWAQYALSKADQICKE